MMPSTLNTTDLIIPAPLDPDTTKEVQQVAVQAFRATGCRGMARVDFFVGPYEGRSAWRQSSIRYRGSRP